MTTGEALWNDFHLESNRVEVSGDEKLRLYFAQSRRALSALARAVRLASGTTNAETRAVDHFVDRLQRTFEALALRHYYDGSGHTLKIDSTDSGFPHFSTLIEMAADLDGRAEELGALPEPPQIKRAMLDQVLRYGLHPRKHQETMLRRLYLESLDPEKLLRAFVSGPLEKVGAKDAESSWFWSFAAYDRSLNRPFVYLIHFSHEGKLEPEAFAEIERTAQQCAGGRLTLLAFSQRWDSLLPALRPRIVKRLILGPYHSPFFTKAECELGRLLESHELRLPFALRWEAETLISERETTVGKGWLSKGQLRQIFWIPKNLDLATRGVSQVERYLIAPHWLIQEVQSQGVLPDHTHLSIQDDESINGID